MKIKRLLFLAALLLPPLFAQKPAELIEPPNRDADPALIHAYNMQILESQAALWQEIAAKTNQAAARDLYIQLAESYKLLKLYREEQALSEQNQTPFHYEKLRGQQGEHTKLLAAAVATYGEKNAPEIPPDVRPKKKPAPSPEDAVVPESTYTTKSGFEVKLRLED